MNLRLLPLIPLFALAVACTVETTSTSPGWYNVPTSTGSGDAPAGSTVQQGTESLRAIVDADQHMNNVAGGQGVGTFVEYQTGGFWHLRWTCDTSRTKQACSYIVKVSAKSDITEAQTDAGTQVTAANATLSLATKTTYGVDGLSFRTAPGEVVTLEVSVDGLKTGAYVFFVQDGKVNGGYEGRLTNPLELVSNNP